MLLQRHSVYARRTRTGPESQRGPNSKPAELTDDVIAPPPPVHHEQCHFCMAARCVKPRRIRLSGFCCACRNIKTWSAESPRTSAAQRCAAELTHGRFVLPPRRIREDFLLFSSSVVTTPNRNKEGSEKPGWTRRSTS